MSATMEITTFMNSLTESSQKAVKAPRVVKKHVVGKHVRQGDLYIVCVNRKHEHGPLSDTNQLATGDTQGSRHYAESPAVCYVGTTAPQAAIEGRLATLLGPYVESSEPFVISHPEHAHIHLPPGAYQIMHQLDPRTMKAVKD